jgi:hypothetical protein
VLGAAAALTAAVVLLPSPVAGADLADTGRAAAAARTGEPAALLRPDLVALPARGLQVQRVDGVRWLRFGSVLGNIGPGPVEIHQNRNRRCPPGQHNATQVIYRDVNGDGRYEPPTDTDVARRRAGCMVYHPQHHHWHFQASARYVLLDPSTTPPTVVAAHRKVSFCLRDSERLPDRYGHWRYPETYGACTSRSRQGLSVGWADLYQSFLAGQALPLPRHLPDGLYCLKTVVDPLHRLVEADDDNNSSVRALSLHHDRVRVRPTAPCR